MKSMTSALTWLASRRRVSLPGISLERIDLRTNRHLSVEANFRILYFLAVLVTKVEVMNVYYYHYIVIIIAIVLMKLIFVNI